MSKSMCLALLIAILPAFSSFADDWKPVPGHLSTIWAAKVDPANALAEYPRPQMVRQQWTSLNGLWDYAIVAKDADQPKTFDGRILVPFPIESSLSGVMKPVTPKDRLWYRRTFKSPDLAGGNRLLLHFGAVDWESQAFVNGKSVGQHRGGYDPFTLDITSAIKPGADNELIVSVFDATGGYQPKGKQNLNAVTKPGGIMYTPCTGIWQTAWLETVPAVSIDALKLIPDIDAGTLRVKLSLRGDAANASVEIAASTGGKEISRASGKASDEIILPVKDAHLWTPDDPFLYDLKVTLKQADQSLDSVDSYFGMRKIALGKDDKGFTRILLNGKFVFQSGPLDQGFWPDGIYTAPTDEALRFDIEETKKLGFNMTRKHVKVEPERWYYWCDKLGLLVWQDMPSGGAGKGKTDTRVSDEAAQQFETELKALVETHWSHPAIVMWIVFNEGWGQYDTPRLTNWVKQLDPSRLVSDASGWTDHPSGDIHDVHAYPGPGCPDAEPNRAAVNGEFGGLGLPVQNHTWVDKTWGYRGMADAAALTKKYVDLWRHVWELKDSKGLCAAVYTQLTDVETECNGLLTYDRKVEKPDMKKAADAAQGHVPPLPTIESIVPSAQKDPVTWRYTTDKPADGWFKPDFNDSTWKEGPAGFGGGKLKNASVRTDWKTPNIWIRRQFDLPDGKFDDAMLQMYHDEDVEVYINGVLAATAKGYVVNYELFEITPEARAALKPGKNTLAIHCLQTIGGQYIDAGLVHEKPAK